MLFVFGKLAAQMRLKKVSELIHRSAEYPACESARVSVYFQEIFDDPVDADAYTVLPGSQVRRRAATRSPRRARPPFMHGHSRASPPGPPAAQFVVTRTALRSNASSYYINDALSSFAEATALLRGRGIDLDNNRFLILQGEVRAARVVG